MKLAYKMFEAPIDWEEHNVFTLVIENPVLYRNTVIDMFEQIRDYGSEFVLSDDFGDIIDFAKYAEVISDVFSVNPETNKKIVGEIIKEVSSIALHDMPDKVMSLFSEINDVISEVVYRSTLDIAYDEFGDIAALFKLYNLRPDVSEATFLEKLLLYIELCNKYLNKRLFIFLNLRDFVTYEEAESFFKDLNYRDINVLMLERHQYKFSEYESRRIIDEDLCEI